ncbi:hypothetical protein PVBG_05665 [Plasmodium vivax Brazil I]|uniref:VIR protein n=1 Tax=Plasmodium vivax (strain Brazil I) TaxID=1033975 RepID=A0A0J9T0S2_PLAV1|nr:hypothetical protein PVBG_05665 [Plasmodium vivax Brazil I]
MNIEDKNLSDKSNICESITWHKKKDSLIRICKKYITYLETSKVLNFVRPDYDVCILLNYWLYEKLPEIFGFQDSLYDISLAFGSLQHIWNQLYHYPRTRVNYNNCKPEYETDNHEDWINRKKLYDYYVDYNYLISMAKNYPKGCIYYKKIKEKHTVFDYFDRHCVSNAYKCPQFYYDFKSYDPENVISTLPCHDQVELTKSASPGPEEATKESSSHHPAGPEAQNAVSGDHPGETDPNVSLHSTQSTPKSSDIGTKVSHSVLGAAPVLLTATMLYRYTPLGPWIRRFGGGRTNSMNTMDTLSPYTEETGNMFPEDTANYISYHPI